MIEATVESVRVSLVTQNRVVILKEKDGNRHVPIWIGAYEAEAIALELQGVTPTRPLPYDLMRAMLEELNATVEHVIISELNDQVYYATIVLTVADRTIQLDSRPSDALALAIRCSARVLIEDTVVANAGITVDDENTEHLPGSSSPGFHVGSSSAEATPPAAEEEGLDVFRDFINTLKMEDFDEDDR